MSSPETRLASELLDRLDRVFVQDQKSNYVDNDADYVEQHKLFSAKINRDIFDLNVKATTDVLCEMLQAREPTSSQFRVFSVGCGGGHFDKTVFEKTLERFPEAKFHYVGIDVGEASCQEARKCFESLQENVTAELCCEDIQKLEVGAYEPFDLVVCVKTLYYMSSLETALSNCLKLLKEKGKLVIINGGCHPWSKLYSKIWFLQNRTPVILSPSIRECLKKMGVTITRDFTNTTRMDLTECFKDDFQLPHHKHILSFLAQCNLELYPEAVSQLVKEYLRAVAEGQPDRVLVGNANDVIIVG